MGTTLCLALYNGQHSHSPLGRVPNDRAELQWRLDPVRGTSMIADGVSGGERAMPSCGVDLVP